MTKKCYQSNSGKTKFKGHYDQTSIEAIGKFQEDDGKTQYLSLAEYEKIAITTLYEQKQKKMATNDDAISFLMYRMMRREPYFDESRGMSRLSYLRSCCIFSIYMWLKKHKNKEQHSNNLQGATTKQDRIAEVDLRDLIQSSELTEKHRFVLEKNILENWSMETIADELGCSRWNVYKLKRQGVDRIMHEFQTRESGRDSCKTIF